MSNQDPEEAQKHYNAYTRTEIQALESELKSWFIERRLDMERNLGLHKHLVENNNFSGVNVKNMREGLPLTHRVLWRDLVEGKPKLESELSSDAKI